MSLARRLIALLLTVCLLACTSARPIGPVTPANVRSQLQPGDKVWVRSRDGGTHEFRVTRVDGQGGLHGEGVNIAGDDIRELRIVQLSAAKTAGLTLVIVAATAAVLAAVLDHAFEDALGNEGTLHGGSSSTSNNDTAAGNNDPLL